MTDAQKVITIMTAEGAVEVMIRLPKKPSSNVKWVGWPVSGEPLLIVEYNGGARWGYLGVSRQKAVAAANYHSTGTYINKRIKPHFEAVRIR